ncbi:MAG: hypothetical protein JW875_06090 [Spirochaetales bacterium]|nr:hypothetical protein [Spirochaetales bacterium]
MSQYAVLRYAYESFFARLDQFAQESGLFTTIDSSEGIPRVSLSVCDICQIVQDKNGQRIIVDEVRYELPSIVSMSLAVVIEGSGYPEILGASGAIIAYMKDNPIIEVKDHNWHGNDIGRVYVEPFIRSPSASYKVSGMPCVVLDYRLEVGINSNKGEVFKRVEKRDIRSEIMPDK